MSTPPRRHFGTGPPSAWSWAPLPCLPVDHGVLGIQETLQGRITDTQLIRRLASRQITRLEALQNRPKTAMEPPTVCHLRSAYPICFLGRFIPALTCSRIISSSNSARAASKFRRSLPSAVVTSNCSLRLLKAHPHRLPGGQGVVHVLHAPEGPVELEDQHYLEPALGCIIQEPAPAGAVGQVVRP